MRSNNIFYSTLWMYLAVTLDVPVCQGQAVNTSTIAPPLIEGDRALRFEVNLEGFDPNGTNVTVFYAASQAALANLQNPGPDVFSGRPVLLRLGGGRLGATFLFSHRNARTTPNRDLYFRMRSTNTSTLVHSQTLDDQAEQAILQGTSAGLGESPIDMSVPTEPFKRGDCVYYVIRTEGRERDATPVRAFRMPGAFCIGLLGDSYSAGEGAPDDPSDDDNSDMWKNPTCHRSNKAGLVRGVKRFIAANVHLDVSWTHRACSANIVVADVIEDQLAQAREKFIGDGEEGVHLLIFSAGGNDLGFADQIVDFIYNPGHIVDDNPFTENDELQEFIDQVETDIAELAERYDDLDAAIHSLEGLPPFVAIMTYPDPTSGLIGRCGGQFFPFIESFYHCCLWETNLIENPVSDYETVSDHFVAPLNEAVRAAADRNRWRVIDLEEAAGEHGICNCEEPWYMLPGTSLLSQGDIQGTVHPNDEGYKQMYRERVRTATVDAYETFLLNRTAVMGWLIPFPEPCEISNSNARLDVENAWESRFKRELDKLKGRTPLGLSNIDPKLLARLRAFVAREDVRALLKKGGIKPLRTLPAFKALTRDLRLDMVRSRTARDRRAARPKQVRRRPLPTAVTVQQRVKALFASTEFRAKAEAQKEWFKSSGKIKQIPEESDPLDKLYNE